jgi:mono/diheme cytochrome c family protein
MKKAIKFLGFGLLALVALIGLGAGYIQVKGVPTYPYAPSPEISSLKVPLGDAALIERGMKIANVVCKDCHRGGSEGLMIGRELAEFPALFGKVYSGNITHDTLKGIGGWTDGELYYFLRTGIRKNGSFALPMPQYNRMAEDDLKSIIAWLRSDDPTLAADPRSYLPNRWNFTLKALANTVLLPPPLPNSRIQLPDTANPIAVGKYLANDVFDCFACHSADLVKADMINPTATPGFYGGGAELQNEEGKPVFTANLTPHPDHGIGKWTTEQFINAVKYGQKPGGGTLQKPMPPFVTLSDSEVAAIHAYLKTVPVIDNKIK